MGGGKGEEGVGGTYSTGSRSLYRRHMVPASHCHMSLGVIVPTYLDALCVYRCLGR